MSLAAGESIGDRFIDPLLAGENAQKKLNLLMDLAVLAHPAWPIDEYIPDVPIDLPPVVRLESTVASEPITRKVRRKRDADSYPPGEQWRADASCQFEPPATFFPTDGVGVEVAKRICETCVVKKPCLEYAIATRTDHGVWGGTSERERTRIIKQRRLT